MTSEVFSNWNYSGILWSLLYTASQCLYLCVSQTAPPAQPETWQGTTTPMGRVQLELGENWARTKAWLILQPPSRREKGILGNCSFYNHKSWCHHHQRTGQGSHWRRQEGVSPPRSSESTCKGHWDPMAWLPGRHRKKTGGFGKLEWGKTTNRSIWEEEQCPRWSRDEKSTCSTSVHIWAEESQSAQTKLVSHSGKVNIEKIWIINTV